MNYWRKLSEIKTLARKAYLTSLDQNLKSPVFFLHVPKCGGTSVKNAIFDRLGILNYLRGQYFQLSAHASREAADVLGAKMRTLRESVLAYEITHNHPVFATGHFVYSKSIHEYISEKYTVVTVIRNPVSKFVSQYLYNKNKSSQDHFGTDMHIDEYLDSERARGTGRLMTSYFAGNEALNNATTVSELVERAIQNIRRFDVVGVLGDLKRFERDFARATGTNIQIAHHRKNPADQSERESILTENRLERIRELCAPDTRLFEAVSNDVQTDH